MTLFIGDTYLLCGLGLRDLGGILQLLVFLLQLLDEGLCSCPRNIKSAQTNILRMFRIAYKAIRIDFYQSKTSDVVIDSD